ncbi:MAG: PKD domain-containing protein [Saprospiraceae bacterium]|nr:PKD domain-containing protein [Saprospiraceae bacterium]
MNIGALPIAAFTSVINNNQAQFTMTGNGHTSQTWNFGDGSNSSDLNPTHVYSASGNYTITLITLMVAVMIQSFKRLPSLFQLQIIIMTKWFSILYLIQLPDFINMEFRWIQNRRI